MSNIIKAKQNKKNFSKDCILDKLSIFLQGLKGVEMAITVQEWDKVALNSFNNLE